MTIDMGTFQITRSPNPNAYESVGLGDVVGEIETDFYFLKVNDSHT